MLVAVKNLQLLSRACIFSDLLLFVLLLLQFADAIGGSLPLELHPTKYPSQHLTPHPLRTLCYPNQPTRLA